MTELQGLSRNRLLYTGVSFVSPPRVRVEGDREQMSIDIKASGLELQGWTREVFRQSYDFRVLMRKAGL